MNDSNQHYISFSLGGMNFEYDSKKNEINIKKHGISLRNAARVFFDYDRIEFYDEKNSNLEDRYDTIGDLTAGKAAVSLDEILIGNVGKDDVIFVVYTERIKSSQDGKNWDVIRLISARYATNFERGLYYGKY